MTVLDSTTFPTIFDAFTEEDCNEVIVFVRNISIEMSMISATISQYNLIFIKNGLISDFFSIVFTFFFLHYSQIALEINYNLVCVERSSIVRDTYQFW